MTNQIDRSWSIVRGSALVSRKSAWPLYTFTLVLDLTNTIVESADNAGLVQFSVYQH